MLQRVTGLKGKVSVEELKIYYENDFCCCCCNFFLAISTGSYFNWRDPPNSKFVNSTLRGSIQERRGDYIWYGEGNLFGEGKLWLGGGG